MNDSTNLRNRILQMREANNLNLVPEKSEHVDTEVIPKEDTTPEDNEINHKDNFKSSVTNGILTQETDDKDQFLLNKKKSLDNETLSNNSNNKTYAPEATSYPYYFDVNDLFGQKEFAYFILNEKLYKLSIIENGEMRLANETK